MNLKSASLLVALSSVALVSSELTAAELACPVIADGETALDCPWAGVSRELDATLAAGGELGKTLRETAPEFLAAFDRDSAAHSGAKSYKSLWGTSVNYDEGAHDIIIKNPVIDFILARAKLPKRRDRVVHAGFEHTYGYLFSNLKTPYGFKRLRWARPDLEQGFGIAAGTIVPLPKDGGLFSNVTYFAGRIAFRHDPQALAIVMKGANVSPALKTYAYADLKPTRLSETISLPNGRTVVLRTDFVPFPKGEFGGNGEALIYSIRDSAQPYPQLISMFPVAKNFRDGALKPGALGDPKPIVTRYNAFVPGVTDSPAKFTGKREVLDQ